MTDRLQPVVAHCPRLTAQTSDAGFSWLDLIPLSAAVLALAGVALTLYVTGRRERRRLAVEHKRIRDDKVDAFNAEQRSAIAAVLASAQTYQREVGHAGNHNLLVSRDEPFARQVVESADATRGQMLNDLTVARLLIHDPRLQEALDLLFGHWSNTGAIFGQFYEAFWAADPDRVLLKSVELREAWPAFQTAAASLQTLALDLLRPTVLTITDVDRV